MSRYKHYITEIMKTPVEYDLRKEGPGAWYTNFYVNTHYYEWYATSDREYTDAMWVIDFNMEGLSGTLGLGMSTALQVFSTVKEIFKEWIRKENPPSFAFSTRAPSKIKLYDKFAKQITTSSPYKLTRKKLVNKDIAWIFKK